MEFFSKLLLLCPNTLVSIIRHCISLGFISHWNKYLNLHVLKLDPSILDFKKNSRLIHRIPCDLDKIRTKNHCQQKDGLQPTYCQSLFVRMTVISDLQNVTASVLKHEDFFSMIHDFFLMHSISIRIAS